MDTRVYRMDAGIIQTELIECKSVQIGSRRIHNRCMYRWTAQHNTQHNVYLVS